MDFSISSRQPDEILVKAQEIRIDFRDFSTIYNLIEKYPEKKFAVLINHNVSEESWIELQAIQEKLGDKFIIGLGSTNNLIRMAKERKLNWYLNQVVTGWREFRSLKFAGAAQVLIGGPLLFSLDAIQKEKGHMLIRFIPNISNYDPSFPYENGIVGSWVRPDDIDLYSNYLDICQFSSQFLSEESTLLRVYSEDKTWHGDLNKLIKDLDVSCNNRGLPQEIGENRINCGQRCQRGSGCQFCFNAILFSEQIKDLKHKGISL